jgi:hypothetical protein
MFRTRFVLYVLAATLLFSIAPSAALAQEPVPQVATEDDVIDPNDTVGSAKFFTIDPRTFEVTDISKEMSQTGYAPEGLCVRTPFGPGKVYWRMSNPRGNGYSVKPENSNTLTWAVVTWQAIDGIYRSNWGSCRAFKVPDHCTVDWYSGDSYYECCNAATALILGRSKYTNTCNSSSPEASWPDHPLR